jgi:predicted DNA-binding transcriptional regulator AlpA
MVQERGEQTDTVDQRNTVNQEDAARYIDFTESYLEKARHDGRGPRYLRIGRTIRYRIRDLDQWLEQHVVETRAERRHA